MCLFAVLQRPDAGQQRWDECDSGEDQPDFDGEVSQTAGCSQNAGEPPLHPYTDRYKQVNKYTVIHKETYRYCGICGTAY